MNDQQSRRCRKTWDESQWHRNCCYRETWEDRDRCIWHATVEGGVEKSVAELRAVRETEPNRRLNEGADGWSPAELLQKAQLQHVDFPDSFSFESCDLQAADLSGANLRGVDFTGADLSGASLSGTVLEDTDLAEATLTGIDLSGADLRGIDLSERALRAAGLSGADLRGVSLAGADLTGADLSEARLDGADLSAATLQRATLTGAVLQGADLSKADIGLRMLPDPVPVGPVTELAGVNLRNATLSGANMRGVDLTSAILVDADLSGADLTDADLSGTEPQLAVNLHEAALPGAVLDGDEKLPTAADLTVAGEDVRVRYGDTLGGEIRRSMVEAGRPEDEAVYVQREHTRLTLDVTSEGPVALITRLGENRLPVNGNPVPTGEGVQISEGDELRFADVVTVSVTRTGLQSDESDGTASTKLCPSCGNDVRDTARFCPDCAHQFEEL